MEDDNIKIGDVDSYDAGKDMAYSHQALIMQGKRRIIELGQHELAEGINETTNDARTGVTKIVYKEDSRRAFINAIKIQKMLMECDYDKDATDKIKKLDKSIVDEKKRLIKEQHKEWVKVNVKTKQMYPNHNPLYLNQDFPFYVEFVEFEIETHMQVFSELNKLAKRLNFYSSEVFEN